MDVLEQIAIDLERKGWSFVPNLINAGDLAFMARLFEVEFVPAKVGRGENLHRNTEIRGDFTAWIDPEAPPAGLERPVQFIQNLQEFVNRKFFLGLKSFECHLAKYPVGAHYSRHSDRHGQHSTRVLTFIFYLHEEWGPGDGGELVLYDQNNQMLETILPTPGSFLCFMADDFPHEVRKGLRERRSFTGWIHTKNI